MTPHTARYMRSTTNVRQSGFTLGILLLATVGRCFANDGAAPNLTLWYEKPAKTWAVESLPIGNGRLGAMLFGGAPTERIQFNEASLWLGDETNAGAYQAFGDVFVDLTHGKVNAYRRELDLNRAVHTVTYESDGVQFRREAFASFPARVIVYRFTADKPGALTGSVSLTDTHQGQITAAGNRLTSSGSLDGYTYLARKDRPDAPYAVALKYEAQVAVLSAGGTQQVIGEKIAFEQADSVALILGAGTDFVQDRSKGWRGAHPHAAVTASLDAALSTPYEKLLADHVKDYAALFGRVELALGVGDAAAEALPTDQRVLNYRRAAADPKATLSADMLRNTSISPENIAPDTGLESLLFHFGRYLLIAASRAGGLPANLQGIWNQDNNPIWRCDYHADVNVEMNYWPADVANLSECFLPFSDWLHSIVEVRREQTRKMLKKETRGWAVTYVNGIFGGSNYGSLYFGGAPWMMQNTWEHYAFSGDETYLRTVAYPMMKEVSEYCLDRLQTLPDGTLVTPPNGSPESARPDGSRTMEVAVAHDMQLVWELFTNTAQAAGVLGVDAEFRDNLLAKRDQLMRPLIGRWGQLQEWKSDIDDPNDHNRANAHLIAVYPGRQISVEKTPDLAKAAAVSLTARGEIGDSRRGWVWAYRCALWARLGEAENAHRKLRGLLTFNTYPSLLTFHAPFQFDAHAGIVAGMCEMLLQSHQGEIVLLPALPRAWAKQGSFTGLRARGGYLVSCAWEDGKVTSYQISPDGHAADPQTEIKIRVNGASEVMKP